TIHMLVALVIVNVLMYAAFKAMSERFVLSLPGKIRKNLLVLAGLLLLATLIQVAFGTQVREAIDAVSRSNPDLARALWLYNVGWIDQLHRSFSWIVLILSAALIYYHRKAAISALPYTLSLAILALVLIQLVLGIGLAYLAMPPAFQVFHLWGASLLVGMEFLFILVVNEGRPVVEKHSGEH
ncbi:MAG: COX15/CtaA family protein, partial [Balneolales bacterium]